MQQIYVIAEISDMAVDPPVTAGITPVEPEPGDDPPDAVVAAILLILPQARVDLFQELAVPPALFRPPESAVVPLLADAQRPAHGLHRPAVQVGADEAVLPAEAYGLALLHLLLAG